MVMNILTEGKRVPTCKAPRAHHPSGTPSTHQWPASPIEPWPYSLGFVGRINTCAASCRLLRQLTPSPLPETTSHYLRIHVAYVGAYRLLAGMSLSARSSVFGRTGGRRGTVRAFVTLSRVVCACVHVTTTCRVCWKLSERRWLPWLRVSTRSARFGCDCS